jgi:hypothetical protein
MPFDYRSITRHRLGQDSLRKRDTRFRNKSGAGDGFESVLASYGKRHAAACRAKGPACRSMYTAKPVRKSF